MGVSSDKRLFSGWCSRSHMMKSVICVAVTVSSHMSRCVTAGYCSYLVYGCHCRLNWTLLWLRPKTEEGPLWLEKNKTQADIKFSARHACRAGENMDAGWHCLLRGQRRYWQIWSMFRYLWLLLAGMCSTVQSSQSHNGTTHSHPAHSLIWEWCNTSFAHKEAQCDNVWHRWKPASIKEKKNLITYACDESVMNLWWIKECEGDLKKHPAAILVAMSCWELCMCDVTCEGCGCVVC